MTKSRLQQIIITVISLYLVALILGLTLRIVGPPEPTPYYSTFKDLVPLIFAIPAAYLGYAFQQRNSYLGSLRALWSKLVSAVNNAIQYTYSNEPSQENFDKVITDLSIVVDEVRGVYKNIGEGPKTSGFYPYEPIKDIYDAVFELGFGKLDEVRKTSTRRKVVGHWKSIRENFLAEFDRAEPTKVVSPYAEE